MKSALLVMFVAALIGVGLSTAAQAQNDENITQEKVERIKEHCVENQASLNRLRQTDAFLRTDRGNLYRTISDKLMLPFNQRLVSNRLDGGELIGTAADFSEEYDQFFDAYATYASSLTNLLSIDCNRQPVSFYNALVEVRENREALAVSNQRLKELVKEYGELFDAFKADFLKKDEA